MKTNICFVSAGEGLSKTKPKFKKRCIRKQGWRQSAIRKLTLHAKGRPRETKRSKQRCKIVVKCVKKYRCHYDTNIMF